jgi:8-oxo-dGTP diphosphatase
VNHKSDCEAQLSIRPGKKHLTASGLVFFEDTLLLLFHSKLNLWLYPGGHVEPDEEPQDALRREIQEEVGIEVDLYSCGLRGAAVPLRLIHPTVELPTPLAVLIEKIPDARSEFHWHIDLVFYCRGRPEQRHLVDSRSEVKRVTLDEIATLNCPAEMPSLMQRALSIDRRDLVLFR